MSAVVSVGRCKFSEKIFGDGRVGKFAGVLSFWKLEVCVSSWGYGLIPTFGVSDAFWRKIFDFVC